MRGAGNGYNRWLATRTDQEKVRNGVRCTVEVCATMVWEGSTEAPCAGVGWESRGHPCSPTCAATSCTPLALKSCDTYSGNLCLQTQEEAPSSARPSARHGPAALRAACKGSAWDGWAGRQRTGQRREAGDVRPARACYRGRGCVPQTGCPACAPGIWPCQENKGWAQEPGWRQGHKRKRTEEAPAFKHSEAVRTRANSAPRPRPYPAAAS